MVDGETGYLVPARDPALFAHYLRADELAAASPETLLRIYAWMHLARTADNRILDLFRQGLIKGTVYSVLVGLAGCRQAPLQLLRQLRTLALPLQLARADAERRSTCGGRVGSMHLQFNRGCTGGELQRQRPLPALASEGQRFWLTACKPSKSSTCVARKLGSCREPSPTPTSAFA